VPARAATAAWERRRPACDQLTSTRGGAQGAHAGDLQQPRRQRLDQDGELGLQLVGLGGQGLDGAGRCTGSACTVARCSSDLVGRARRLAQCWIWLAVLRPQRLGAQLLRGAHDQRP
jgi:hypothetical protein